jgi:hypothetical protein
MLRVRCVGVARTGGGLLIKVLPCARDDAQRSRGMISHHLIEMISSQLVHVAVGERAHLRITPHHHANDT